MRTLRPLCLVLFAVTLLDARPGPAGAGTLAAASSDFLERYALTRGFRSGQPTAIAVPPGVAGGAPNEVLFLRSGPRDRVQSLWAFDWRTGAEDEILTGSKLLGGAE